MRPLTVCSYTVEKLLTINDLSHLKINYWFQIINEQLSNKKVSQDVFSCFHFPSINHLTGKTQPKGRKISFLEPAFNSSSSDDEVNPQEAFTSVFFLAFQSQHGVLLSQGQVSFAYPVTAMLSG